MINCLIVDDEPVAQEIIARYIEGYDALQLMGKCSTAFEAFEVLHAHQVDLLFLDIKMPGMSGIDFIKSLKMPPAVIFTTAYSEYAATSYDLEAVDYLLKPITPERFDKSLEKFFKLQVPEVEEQKDYTYFKVSGKLVKVKHDEIVYAQSVKDYVILHTNQANLITHMTMKYLCGQLPHGLFFRIHRSYLVNRQFVSTIGRNSVTVNEVEIPIGERYKGEVLKLKRGL